MTDWPLQAGRSAIRRRALWWATVLCDHPEAPDSWAFGRQGDDAVETVLRVVRSIVMGSEQAPRLEASDFSLASGSGGLVVLLHGEAWSLAARAGGPVVIVCAEYPDGLTIQDQSFDTENSLGTASASTSYQETVDLVDTLIEWAR